MVCLTIKQQLVEAEGLLLVNTACLTLKQAARVAVRHHCLRLKQPRVANAGSRCLTLKRPRT